jgi:putative FmdB family regulatory protein
MPIYAYRCSACQHTQDVLRKISDPPLLRCTACQQDTFVKQVTSAGFALKGTGWYVTDFREGSKKEAATSTVGGAVSPAATTPVAPESATTNPPSSASTQQNSTGTNATTVTATIPLTS